MAMTLAHALLRDQPAHAPRVVAIVGAESTGKTTLALDLTAHMQQLGMDVVMVPEYLRLFCEQQQRTPTVQEQWDIANAQSQAIAKASAAHAWVVADTTALMTAVYSDMVFEDCTLYDSALQAHAHAGITLLTALDLPWVADGLQRDGPHVREPVDALIRQALLQAQLPFALVGGLGPSRVQRAWAAVERHWAPQPAQEAGRVRWRWVCERCDDGDCEQHSLQSV